MADSGRAGGAGRTAVRVDGKVRAPFTLRLRMHDVAPADGARRTGSADRLEWEMELLNQLEGPDARRLVRSMLNQDANVSIDIYSRRMARSREPLGDGGRMVDLVTDIEVDGSLTGASFRGMETTCAVRCGDGRVTVPRELAAGLAGEACAWVAVHGNGSSVSGTEVRPCEEDGWLGWFEVAGVTLHGSGASVRGVVMSRA